MRRVEIKRSGKTIGTFDLYAFIAEGSKAGDISLQDGDIIHIPAMGNLVALTGLVKQPALYETLPAETVASIIKRAGGVQPEAEQAALQIEMVDKGWMRPLESAADYAGVAGLLKATAGTPLKQGGIYRISSPESAALRANITQQYVKVDGEVSHPGVYKLQKGETLRDLIARVGGVSEDAYLYGMVLSRPSIREQQQKALDEAVDRFEKESEAAATAKLSSTTLTDTAALAQAELERNRKRAQAMRKIQAVGRVALEFNDYRLKLKDLPDFPLENGDAIYIPRQPGTINVFGAVNNATAFIFKQNRRVSDYLQLAGGINRNADQDEIYLLKADGTALNRASTGWFTSVNGYKLAPGDSIIVPENIEHNMSFTQSFKEWTTILYQFGLGAAGLKVLKN
jgi:protein involved in polysaccharide export with SLBB domain